MRCPCAPNPQEERMISRLSHRLVVAAVLATAAVGLLGIGPATAAVPAAPPPDAVVKPIRYKDLPTAVKDSYIVVLPTNTTPADTSRIASELSTKYGGTLGFVYNTGIRGFSVRLTASQAELLTAEPDVDYVAQNQVATLDDVQVQLNP